MLHSTFGKWLANGIRLSYLLSMGVAFFAFFSHLVLTLPELTWVIAGLLSVALVAHEFMQTQRTTVMWARVFRDFAEKKPVKSSLTHALFNTLLLSGLLAFDVLMMLNYVTMKDTGAFPFPILELDKFQSLLIPALGLAASLMVEVEDRAIDVLAHAANDILFQTTKKVSKQHKKRLKDLDKSGHNMAPIMTGLLVQSGEHESASLLQTIENGLAVAEGFDLSKSGNLYSSAGQKRSGAKALLVDNRNGLPVQTGKGSPITSLEQVSELAQSGSPKPTGGGNPKGGRKRRAVIQLRPMDRAVRFVSANQTATLSQIMEGANVSKDTAIKARNEVLSGQDKIAAEG